MAIGTSVKKLPTAVKNCTRKSSVTARRPPGSTSTDRGLMNWPGRLPKPPHAPIDWPSWPKAWMRWLKVSAT